jgi:hypothetical protein
MFMLIDSAAISEPTKKIALQSNSIGLRPKISDTLPAGSLASVGAPWITAGFTYPKREWQRCSYISTA